MNLGNAALAVVNSHAEHTHIHLFVTMYMYAHACYDVLQFFATVIPVFVIFMRTLIS